ncbi:hypothetical protein L6452_31720 [Arctium lappa]|uniref:Uncharacterized protein n=1 Tax=Arctium lappa TaxID=4217 RepID=A0ACB8Z2Z1_ARCLA|nr:hypothetical protein L6452_31720 [Arctium lappa]
MPNNLCFLLVNGKNGGCREIDYIPDPTSLDLRPEKWAGKKAKMHLGKQTGLASNQKNRPVIAPKQPNTVLFVGLNKGHVVTKKELAPRPSDRKGVSNFFQLEVDLFMKVMPPIISFMHLL